MSQNISGTLHLSITNLGDSSQVPVSNLKSDVLNTYGDVQILYEDTAPVGTTGALWTAYGYDAADGSHSGVFLVFYQEESAYVVDVDGRTEEEFKMLETVKTISESWVARPGASGATAGEWRPTTINDLKLWVSSDLQEEKLSNDWYKFTGEDGLTFFAIRSESAEGGRILDRMRHWLDIAARDVNDFAFTDFYTLNLPGNDWIRLEFNYGLSDGSRMAGSIMATRLDEEILYTWAEAPEDIYNQYEQERFMLSLANLRQRER